MDLAHIRLWREFLATGRKEAVVEAYRHWEMETAVFRQADAVIAVTPLEAKMISRLAPEACCDDPLTIFLKLL